MSLSLFPWHLNIRQKVILGLSAGILAIGFIGVISYHYLQVIELKQDFVEVADDLRNITLELRRYEKNYLLYGSVEDLKENQHYIQLGLKIIGKIDPETRGLEGAPQVNQLRQEFIKYKTIMDQMSSTPEGQPRSHEMEEQLRERGKHLVELTHQLADFERLKILKNIQRLKTQLLTSIGIFLVLGGFLVFIVSRKILQPLRIIEKTTHRIAMGNFAPLPVLDTRDETQRVVEAFNRMVQELEKRQDQLLQAKKLSSLGVLTSGVAHQLNNPLNNISTSCQILLEELDTKDLEFFRKMLTNVEQEVDRARDIVKGLLEFSRAKEFTLKATPLKPVVDRSVRLISSQVPAGVEIVEQVPEELTLQLDAQRMQEALLNLLMNAIQALDNQPGQIKIEAGIDRNKQEAVITVADTGTGIPKKDLGRIFDPFFTTKDVGTGTGLGLSIVYGIIEKHRGTISAESTEGEGTRFIIRLPLNPETPAERPSP
jgi:two-component system NtrC family sensor kinase|uniref:histidine kinase n=1 Tax=Desulfobacca acetoxidans TaxID=60893 RepID=A0A7V6A6I1_9BACT